MLESSGSDTNIANHLKIDFWVFHGLEEVALPVRSLREREKVGYRFLGGLYCGGLMRHMC